MGAAVTFPESEDDITRGELANCEKFSTTC